MPCNFALLEIIRRVRNGMERVYVFVLQVILKRLAHSAPDGHTTQTPSTDEKDKFPSCKGTPGTTC